MKDAGSNETGYKEQDRYDDAEQLLLAAIKGRRLRLSDEYSHAQESIKT